MENLAFDGLNQLEQTYKTTQRKDRPALLNAYTADFYAKAAQRWNELEAKYWLMFGRGF